MSANTQNLTRPGFADFAAAESFAARPAAASAAPPRKVLLEILISTPCFVLAVAADSMLRTADNVHFFQLVFMVP